MRSILFVLLVALAGSITVTAQDKITVKGSDTMVILAQRWAETYMAEHPDAVIQVTGGGSGRAFVPDQRHHRHL